MPTIRAPWRLIPLLLLLGSAARAQDAPTTAVFVGEPGSADVAGRVAEMLALLRPPVNLSEVPQRLGNRVPGDGLLTFGAEGTRPCLGERVAADGFRAELTEMHDAVWVAEDLAPVFESAHAAQRCLSGPLGPAELARVDFIEGVMAFETGDVEGARASFAQVFAVAPEFVWDGQFGPGAEASFEEERARAAAATAGTIRFAAAQGVAVWLDGRPLADPLSPSALAPGRHLVQAALGPDGGVDSLEIVIADAAVVTMVDLATLHADLEGDPGYVDRLLRVAGPLFVAMDAADAGSAPGHLVSLVGTARVWRWDGVDRTLVELALPKAALAALAPPVEGGKKAPGPAMPILLAVGGGLVAGGSVLAAVTGKDLDQFDADIESGELWPFPGPEEAHPEEFPLYVQWQEKRRTIGAGYVLIAVGGAAMVASIPVGILTAKPARQQVALGVVVVPGPGRRAGGPAVEAVGITFSLRPARGVER